MPRTIKILRHISMIIFASAIIMMFMKNMTDDNADINFAIAFYSFLLIGMLVEIASRFPGWIKSTFNHSGWRDYFPQLEFDALSIFRFAALLALMIDVYLNHFMQ